jgi:hypothetical protein
MVRRVKHVKRQSTYKVVTEALVQTDVPLKDYDRVMVYQSEKDGSFWVRPISEFEDGRFQNIEEVKVPAILEPLVPLSDPASEATVRASGVIMPEHYVAGYLGKLRFVVTLQANGQLECSLSCAEARPTTAQIAAFFRKWGMSLPDVKGTLINSGRGLYWVLRKGAPH